MKDCQLTIKYSFCDELLRKFNKFLKLKLIKLFYLHKRIMHVRIIAIFPTKHIFFNPEKSLMQKIGTTNRKIKRTLASIGIPMPKT